jgi:glycosyltransferase involved in cell wall biosynthesis
MLVTDVGGLSEIIENNKSGYVVQGNQEAIANAMFDFLENDRFQEFSLEVAKKKHEFSWPFFAKELLQ